MTHVPGGNPDSSVCHVIHEDGSSHPEFSRETVEGLLATGKFFWLDLDKPQPGDFEVLRDVFKFDLLAIEDSEKFGQRAKIEEYDDFVFLVLYGKVPGRRPARRGSRLLQRRNLVTVHRDDCPGVRRIREPYEKREKPIENRRSSCIGSSTAWWTASSRSSPTSTTRSTSSRTAIFLRADYWQLQEIFQMKRLLVGMRKAVTPQRDVFARVMGGVAELPGLSQEDERYFRDVYDHLIRISDLIDSYRDLLSGAMDVYPSTVSNRKNGVMKQLTIIATIFLRQLDHRVLRAELRLRGASHRRLSRLLLCSGSVRSWPCPRGCSPTSRDAAGLDHLSPEPSAARTARAGRRATGRRAVRGPRPPRRAGASAPSRGHSRRGRSSDHRST